MWWLWPVQLMVRQQNPNAGLLGYSKLLQEESPKNFVYNKCLPPSIISDTYKCCDENESKLRGRVGAVAELGENIPQELTMWN